MALLPILLIVVGIEDAAKITLIFLGVVFGFARDTFNPLGRRDRGYFMLFGAATSAIGMPPPLTKMSMAAIAPFSPFHSARMRSA